MPSSQSLTQSSSSPTTHPRPGLQLTATVHTALPTSRDLILTPFSPLADLALDKCAIWWTISKCGASLVSLVATTAVPAAKLWKMKIALEELGGVKDAAKLLVGATKVSEWTAASMKFLLGLAVEVTGVGLVGEVCPLSKTLVGDLRRARWRG